MARDGWVQCNHYHRIVGSFSSARSFHRGRQRENDTCIVLQAELRPLRWHDPSLFNVPPSRMNDPGSQLIPLHDNKA